MTNKKKKSILTNNESVNIF